MRKLIFAIAIMMSCFILGAKKNNQNLKLPDIEEQMKKADKISDYEAKKDVSNFSHHMTQLRTLTDAIKSSGDGKSEKTAYVVNTVGDEYILLNILNIGQDYERHSQASKDAMFDIWQKGEDKLYVKVLYLGF